MLVGGPLLASREGGISTVTDYICPQNSVPSGDSNGDVVKSESHLGICPWLRGSKSVLGLVNAHFYMISPIGHGPRFARKEPFRSSHAGRESLTNLLGAAWTSSESRMHVQRCDVATTSPSPTPRRLPHGRHERRSGQARAATGPRRCTIRVTPGGPQAVWAYMEHMRRQFGANNETFRL